MPHGQAPASSDRQALPAANGAGQQQAQPTTPATQETAPETPEGMPRVVRSQPDIVEIGPSNPNPLGIVIQQDTRASAQTPAPAEQARPAGEQPGAPTGTMIAPFTPPAATGLTPEDLERRTAVLKAALDRAVRGKSLHTSIDGVMLEPRNGYATVEYTITRMAGPLETKQYLLYAAFTLIWSAMDENAAPAQFTVRGFAEGGGGSGSSLALVADITQTQANAARYADNYALVVNYLTNPWWRADLARVEL
jgi:hypothetical protein